MLILDYVDAENLLHAVDSINTTECETVLVHSQDIVAMLPVPYTDSISMFYAAVNLNQSFWCELKQYNILEKYSVFVMTSSNDVAWSK